MPPWKNFNQWREEADPDQRRKLNEQLCCSLGHCGVLLDDWAHGDGMTETCKSCRFFAIEHGWAKNECHRRAPRIHMQALLGTQDQQAVIGPRTIWPEVFENNYCGEWQEIEAE